MAFTVRPLNKDDTLGTLLHRMRRNLNFTLDEMAQKTKIQRKHLEALEKDAFDLLPEPLYARQLVKTYVKALGGNIGYCLARYEEACGRCDLVEPMRTPRQRARAVQFLAAHRILKVALLALLALSVLGYLGYELRLVFEPPELLVFEPADGFSTDDAVIAVSGRTEPETEIFVNGLKVLPTQDGSFETEVTLERGVNVITVEGKTRHSRTATVYRRVILEYEINRRPASLSTTLQTE